MTSHSDEPDPDQSTQEIPITQPTRQPDWREQPVVVRPMGEAKDFGATRQVPPETTGTKPFTPLRRQPFKGVRFAFKNPVATATFYVNEGVKRQKDFRKKERHLTVIKNGATDTALIPKLDFIPEDGEDEIRYLERRHWMYFGRVAIPHALLWLTASTLYVSYGLDRYAGDRGLIVLGLWFIAWTVYVGLAFLHWYCVYILITNTRLYCVRNYPLINLPVLDQHLATMSETTITPMPVRLLANHGFDFAKLTASVIGGGKSVEWLTKQGFSFLKHPMVLQSITRPS